MFENVAGGGGGGGGGGGSSFFFFLKAESKFPYRERILNDFLSFF